jgi:hypothetical protein
MMQKHEEGQCAPPSFLPCLRAKIIGATEHLDVLALLGSSSLQCLAVIPSAFVFGWKVLGNFIGYVTVKVGIGPLRMYCMCLLES